MWIELCLWKVVIFFFYFYFSICLAGLLQGFGLSSVATGIYTALLWLYHCTAELHWIFSWHFMSSLIFFVAFCWNFLYCVATLRKMSMYVCTVIWATITTFYLVLCLYFQSSTAWVNEFIVNSPLAKTSNIHIRKAGLQQPVPYFFWKHLSIFQHINAPIFPFFPLFCLPVKK